MSRVFQALEKASKETNKAIPKPAIAPPPLASPTIAPPPRAEDLPRIAVAPETNGKAQTFAPPSRSWRERMEELFFGLDLKRKKNYPLVALEKGSPAADQYKILREQMKRLRAEKGIRLISVTSPVKQDGKSMVAANLAAAMALDYDEKVLLIDCDLRQPQIHKYFGVSDGPGLTNLLTSSSNGSLSGYVRDTFLPGLQILTAGPSLALSSELLSTDKMKIVMDEIRRMFPDHQIIIDSPPVLSTADPLVLAGQVDGIIMVIRAGQTPRDCLPEAMDTLKSNKIVGIVLNGAELGMRSKYYNYQS